MLVCLTLAHCSDDSEPAMSFLTVNGAKFNLANNSGSGVYNIIKSKSESTIWLNITENAENARVISIYAMHEPGDATGIYTLRNNFIESGIAAPALYDSQGVQLAGGSSESQPTGTVSIVDRGHNRYIVVFNEVVLDPGTATETTISGTCDKIFKLASGN